MPNIPSDPPHAGGLLTTGVVGMGVGVGVGLGVGLPFGFLGPELDDKVTGAGVGVGVGVVTGVGVGVGVVTGDLPFNGFATFASPGEAVAASKAPKTTGVKIRRIESALPLSRPGLRTEAAQGRTVNVL